jgi:hypothetical protein
MSGWRVLLINAPIAVARLQDRAACCIVGSESLVRTHKLENQDDRDWFRDGLP